ncbi:hypothetical protein [Umezawaea beigongshangensis]|uniref:hypothetical protein n=1 Tax=Umezawaea beigongshangensis TaxID=2780383 RepID=UPI0018F1178D|nr:hypothetical protein [Umezawaea beigongshangensis]
MSTGAVIGIVIAVLVALAVGAVLLRKARQRQRLRSTFGPEYERTVEGSDNRTAAEKELAQREKEHAKLDLRPLTPEVRDSYSRHWTTVQEKFVDDPSGAVGDADRLVTDLMAERGYPTDGYEKQASLLSVEHSRTLEHYRAAHDISQRQDRGEASTEDLRNAMVHYRTLFEDLLHTGATSEGAARHGDAVPHDAKGESSV